MAKAFFNEFTGGRHRGMSAESQPAKRVNPNAVKVMAEVGIDIRQLSTPLRSGGNL